MDPPSTIPTEQRNMVFYLGSRDNNPEMQVPVCLTDAARFSFSFNLRMLAPTTEYYFKAYIGSETGEIIRFTTDEIFPTDVSVTPKVITLEIGGTQQLKAAVLPANASDKSVLWTSDDPSVADVSENGVVTALVPGFVLITAETVNGLTDICAVTVSEKPVITITEQPKNMYFQVGNINGSLTIAAEVTSGTPFYTWYQLMDEYPDM